MSNWITVEMFNTSCIERRGASNNSMNLVSFGEEKFSQVGAVLKPLFRQENEVRVPDQKFQ